jgi:CheY-like chemotaxis protein
VLLNLAANARDAMPGGGQLTIATANVPAGEHGEGDCEATGEFVALTVTDNGAGMSAETRERVFERFFTTKTAGEGTGLGLASAHRFVKRSGGCISIRSAPGEGTSIVVYLPRAATSSRIEAAPASEPEPAGGRETVVVVEQDDHVRFVVRATLVGRGYRVLDAPSGELALRMVNLAETHVDLVLADVGTPGMRGAELSATLRDSGHVARLLMMSGLPDRDNAELGVCPEQPVLRKAFTPTALAKAVRAALDAPENDVVQHVAAPR